MIDAANFWWDYQGWYYLYTWTPQRLWDNGRWVTGRELCTAVAAAPSYAWHAIFNWPENRAVLFDTNENTKSAACFHVAQLAPPGTVIA